MLQTQTTKLTGREAIEFARKAGCLLSKYACPTEDDRTDLTVEEAEEVAAEDPSLIYLSDLDVADARLQAAQQLADRLEAVPGISGAQAHRDGTVTVTVTVRADDVTDEGTSPEGDMMWAHLENMGLRPSDNSGDSQVYLRDGRRVYDHVYVVEAALQG